jgi:5'-phosphate synthase pdxT subunit
VGVLALQGDVAEHLSILAGLGAPARAVRQPADLEGVGALVLPGGESTTISLLLASSGLLEPLRERLGAGMPALGTCAGMILLAREVVDGRPDQLALGAIDVVVRRNAFGRQVDSFETDLEVTGVDGGPLHAVFIRAPVVEKVGDDVEVLASVSAGGVNRPVVCRQGGVLVAAFHPELAGEGRLHGLLLEQVGSS